MVPNPFIGVVNVIDTGSRGGLEVLWKSGFAKDGFEGLQVEGGCKPIGIAIGGDGVVEGDGGGRDSGRRGHTACRGRMRSVSITEMAPRVKDRLCVWSTGGGRLIDLSREEIDLEAVEGVLKGLDDEIGLRLMVWIGRP